MIDRGSSYSKVNTYGLTEVPNLYHTIICDLEINTGTKSKIELKYEPGSR